MEPNEFGETIMDANEVGVPIIDPGHRTCIYCGELISPGDEEFDPVTGEGPMCPACQDEQGTDDDFDFGEDHERED